MINELQTMNGAFGMPRGFLSSVGSMTDMLTSTNTSNLQLKLDQPFGQLDRTILSSLVWNEMTCVLVAHWLQGKLVYVYSLCSPATLDVTALGKVLTDKYEKWT